MHVNCVGDRKMADAILDVKGLKKYFPVSRGIFSRGKDYIRAVDNLDFQVSKHESLGLVGESGCGKSTTGKVILRLIEPTDGRVVFEGRDVFELSENEMKKLRRDVQMVFQDPFTALDPKMTVGKLVEEPLIIHDLASDAERKKFALEALQKVGLDQEGIYERFPHEFSGGQRQRIAIARVLVLNPRFIVADEPVSALDVSVRAQILNLFQNLKKELGLTYLFIAHDLSAIRYLCDRVAVMYLGKIVEIGPTALVFNEPKHPYTKALLSAIPIPDPRHVPRRLVLQGDVPSPINLPSGCRFRTRCPIVTPECGVEEPTLITDEYERSIACHLPMEKA